MPKRALFGVETVRGCHQRVKLLRPTMRPTKAHAEEMHSLLRDRRTRRGRRTAL